MRTRGFTLIELLTVIAIVGVLAAITIPVVGGVRAQAKNTSSVSNLRQIGVALLTFANEHKGAMPTAGGYVVRGAIDPGSGLPGWTEQLLEYVGGDWEIYKSPRNQDLYPTCSTYGYFLGARAAQVSDGPFKPLILGRIAMPSRHLLAGEVAVNRFFEFDADKDDSAENNVFDAEGRAGFPDGKVNLLLADGHVEAFTRFDRDKLAVRYEGTGYDY